jgi:hypothetical protein
MIFIEGSAWAKCLVALTKLVQPELYICSFNEAVLGTLPIACKEKLTVPAKPGQGIPFVPSEGSLFFQGDKFGHRCLQDISEQILRLDELPAMNQKITDYTEYKLLKKN